MRQAFWEGSAILKNVVPGSTNPESVLCLPLIAVEKAIGVIYLSTTDRDRRLAKIMFIF